MQGRDPKGRVFLEVGTGRAAMVPLAYWLMGVGHTVTFDRNRYLTAELIREHLKYASEHVDEIRAMFGSLLEEDRFDKLLKISSSYSLSVNVMLDKFAIEYLAPSDAGKTGLHDRSIDFHTSRVVLEHIPRDELVQILQEGNRVVRPDGLFVHRIDYSDHFAQTDPSTSRINFLQHSDLEWEKLAGNRYMYANRLRHDDFLELFESVGHDVLSAEADIDRRALEALECDELTVDARFLGKSNEVLSTTGAWIVSGKSSASVGTENQQ